MKPHKTVLSQSLSASDARSHHQHGFTLIEVLIALVVLTIGLAAMASLQISSMQYVHSSHYRSLATTIAMDFEERMWLALADSSLAGCPDVSDAAGSPKEQLAAHWNLVTAGENWDWSTAEMLRIPNLTITPGTPVLGVAVVEVPITLSWSEARFGDREPTIESFTYNVRIQCRSI